MRTEARKGKPIAYPVCCCRHRSPMPMDVTCAPCRLATPLWLNTPSLSVSLSSSKCRSPRGLGLACSDKVAGCSLSDLLARNAIQWLPTLHAVIALQDTFLAGSRPVKLTRPLSIHGHDPAITDVSGLLKTSLRSMFEQQDIMQPSQRRKF